MKLLWKIGTILACLVLAACGTNDDDFIGDATPEPTPQAAGSPTVSPPVSIIGTIIWSETSDPDSGGPVDPVIVFTPHSSAIIASLEVTDIPVGTEFTATWTLNDQPIDGSDMHVSAQRKIEQGWVTFQFTREEGTYPTGQLGVIITTSEGELREGSIEIAFP